jgi:predicted TIM-barrel fold metal-dependent hydrolase
MEIVNAHTHLTKKAVREVKKGSVDDLLKDMREAGISKCLVFSSFGEGEEVDYSMEELFEISKKDKFFEIIYSLDLNGDLSKQKKILEEYFKKGLIKGIKILLGYFSIIPDDEKLLPFYDLCEKYDCPVILHTGDTLFSNAKLKYSHPLNVDSLAVDRPKLKIVMAHVGNPWLVDAAEVIYKNENVYGDISGFFMKFGDKEYEDLVVKRLNELIAYAGGKKLLFGTDFPLVDAVRYVEFVKRLDLSKEELELTFYKNAERLFKLKWER